MKFGLININNTRHLMACIVFTLLNNLCVGQNNLVPNPSFEIYTVCPYTPNDPPPPPWYAPTNYGNTYANACSTSPYTGVPYNASGNFQNAHTGSGYIGLAFINNFGDNNRNYLQVKLNNSLKSGCMYYVEFYAVSQDNVSSRSNNVAAFLSKTAVYVDTINTPYGVLNKNAQIFNYGNPIIKDTQNWVKVSSLFKATGGEQYLTLGNFKNDNQTSYITIDASFYDAADYYIDDVSVILLDSYCLKADAGKDTTINIGDSIFIGSYTNGIDSLKWLQNGAAIDSTRPGFWVKPSTGTSYILQQTINGCFSADTVTIGVLVPLKFIGYELQITNTVGGSLPSTLGEGLGVRSIWQTTNEINVSHFKIQRSINGKDFITIGTQKAQNKNFNEYNFIDALKTNDQYPKTLYYRIQSIDRDGKISYSEVKQIRLNQLTNQPINIYPNPTTGLVHISIPKEEQGVWNIKVQDVTGRVLQTKKTSAVTKTMDLVVSNQAGLYYITLENNTTNKKIVEKVAVE